MKVKRLVLIAFGLSILAGGLCAMRRGKKNFLQRLIQVINGGVQGDRIGDYFTSPAWQHTGRSTIKLGGKKHTVNVDRIAPEVILMRTAESSIPGAQHLAVDLYQYAKLTTFPFVEKTMRVGLDEQLPDQEFKTLQRALRATGNSVGFRLVQKFLEEPPKLYVFGEPSLPKKKPYEKSYTFDILVENLGANRFVIVYNVSPTLGLTSLDYLKKVATKLGLIGKEKQPPTEQQFPQLQTEQQFQQPQTEQQFPQLQTEQQVPQPPTEQQFPQLPTEQQVPQPPTEKEFPSVAQPPSEFPFILPIKQQVPQPEEKFPHTQYRE